MGTRFGKRADAKTKVRIIGTQGPVAQLLHPDWLRRDSVPVAINTLQTVDAQLSQSTMGVKLVVGGGGFLEIYLGETYSPRTWKSETTLASLTHLVQQTLQPVAAALQNTARDYVIGVDVLDARGRGGGQFAVYLSAGKICTMAWKSYPVLNEARYLAGFGTTQGLNSPRIVASPLGKVLLLVCHDSQAYNHRNSALVGLANSPTLRQHVIDSMVKMIQAQKPAWTLGLVHQIDRAVSINTFRTSYKQIHSDHGVSAVVGAFGYGPKVRSILPQLASKMQAPDGTASVVAILEVI